MRTHTTLAEQRGFQALGRAVFETIEPRLLLSAAILNGEFNGTGCLVEPLAGDNYIFATNLLPDGRMLLAGSSMDAGGNSDVLLMCRLANGQADPSFGLNGNGIVTLDLGTDADAAYAMAVQPDGKIVLAGQTVTGASYDFAVMRFTALGVLDASFGDGGIVVQDISGAMDQATAVAVTSGPAGDRIMVAGAAQENGVSIPAAIRLDSSGGLDTTFGNNGIATVNTSGFDTRVVTLVKQADGSYVLGATSRDPSTDVTSLAAIGLHDDGSVDDQFGTAGITRVDPGQGGAALAGMALDASGGVWMVGNSGAARDGIGGDFAIAKLTSSGAMDATFNGSGILTIDFNGGNDGAQAIAIASDGTAYVAGYAMTLDGSTHFAVAGVNANGTLDPAFGTTIVAIADAYEQANALSLNGSLMVLAGTSNGYDADPAAIQFTFATAHENTAPVVTESGDATGVRGQPRSFSAAVQDADGDTMEIAWDFGDGQSIGFVPVTDAGVLNPTHVFLTEGMYTVTATVRDTNGASSVATSEIVVTPFSLQADANNPKKINLIVGGTAGNDTILFTRNGCRKQPGMKLKLNGKSYGPFSVADRLIAFGQSGDDIISLVGPDWTPCEFHGGDGNDLLKGSLGRDTLDGGNGDDWVIPGWSKRDVIEAGPGKNHVGWFKWRPLVRSGILEKPW